VRRTVGAVLREHGYAEVGVSAFEVAFERPGSFAEVTYDAGCLGEIAV
jgi:hypothetical protein